MAAKPHYVGVFIAFECWASPHTGTSSSFAQLSSLCVFPVPRIFLSNIYPLSRHQVQPKEFHPHSLNTLSYYCGSIAAVKDCLQYFTLGESKYFCLGHSLKQTEYYFWTALDAAANPRRERLIFRSLRMGGQR